MSTLSFTDSAAGTEHVTTAVGLAVPCPTALASAALPTSVTAALTLISPTAQQVVPSARPTFTVSVTTASVGGTLQVQIDDDAAFTSPVVASGDAPAGLDAAYVTAQSDTALADETTYWWRARISTPAGATDWSDPAQFAVNTPDGTAVAPGAWTVQPGLPPVPHLWHFGPDTGTTADDDAIIVGTGFGEHPTLLLGELDITASIIDFASVPAATDLTGRVAGIDPAGDITTYYQAISFTIPDLGDDSGGDIVTVEYGA